MGSGWVNLELGAEAMLFCLIPASAGFFLLNLAGFGFCGKRLPWVFKSVFRLGSWLAKILFYLIKYIII